MQYVKFELIPSDTTRLLEVEAGELDVDNILPYNQIATLKSSATAMAKIDRSTETYYFLFNTKVKPFDDVNVRQAISHAINRAAIVKAVTYGYGKPANSFLPAGALYYDSSIPVPTYSLALAKQYLAKSSVPHGFAMTMETPAADSVANEEAQIVQQELAALRINVTIKQIDPTTLLNNQTALKYDFSETLWTNDIPDPDELVSYAMDYQHGGVDAFFTSYDNPQAIKLSSEGEQSNNTVTRRNAYYQIQQIWARDQPFLALYYVPYVNAVSTKVHGFSENPLAYFNLQGVTKS
jgi:peptide/nickel transport system substrate-binding protein